MASRVVLPPAVMLPSTNATIAASRGNELSIVHVRQFYQEENGQLAVQTLSASPAGAQDGVNAAGGFTSGSATGPSANDVTLNWIHGLIVKALENPSNRWIVGAAISALEEVDHHSDLWGSLDERLVHTQPGRGARSMEATLRKLRDQVSPTPETHHLKLRVYSSSQTHVNWVVEPENRPVTTNGLPPLVLDTHGSQLPDYCLYIRVEQGAITKAWIWVPNKGWKGVVEGERHPIYQDRILRLARNDKKIMPSWPKDASMGVMKRRERGKLAAAS